MDDVPSRVEHTVLGPTTTPADVRTCLDAAIELGMRACVPSCYVEQAADYAPGVDVTGVVGFPHGQHPIEVKCTEAIETWEAGAAELDVVANVGLLRAGETDAVTEELAEVVAAVPIPVKVIVEAPLLEEARLRQACEAASEAGADFVKTATGFSEGGATLPDVRVMSEYLPVKASGGIGSWERVADFFDAGAERIGASSGDVIVREYHEAEGPDGRDDSDDRKGDEGEREDEEATED